MASIDQATITKWLSAIGAAAIIILQGVNLHSTGEIGHEAKSADQHIGAELIEIRKVQESINESLNNQRELLKNQHEGLEHLSQLVEENKRLAEDVRSWLKKTTPTPSQ